MLPEAKIRNCSCVPYKKKKKKKLQLCSNATNYVCGAMETNCSDEQK